MFENNSNVLDFILDPIRP